MFVVFVVFVVFVATVLVVLAALVLSVVLVKSPVEERLLEPMPVLVEAEAHFPLVSAVEAWRLSDSSFVNFNPFIIAQNSLVINPF